MCPTPPDLSQNLCSVSCLSPQTRHRLEFLLFHHSLYFLPRCLIQTCYPSPLWVRSSERCACSDVREPTQRSPHLLWRIRFHDERALPILRTQEAVPPSQIRRCRHLLQPRLARRIRGHRTRRSM